MKDTEEEVELPSFVERTKRKIIKKDSVKFKTSPIVNVKFGLRLPPIVNLTSGLTVPTANKTQK